MRCVPSLIGASGESGSGHHGWSPSILVQVSNILLLNTNGNIQLSQLVRVGGYVGGSLVADQIARNPLSPNQSSDTNLMLSLLVLEMMVHG